MFLDDAAEALDVWVLQIDVCKTCDCCLSRLVSLVILLIVQRNEKWIFL